MSDLIIIDTENRDALARRGDGALVWSSAGRAP
jgi:hypothetical protein